MDQYSRAFKILTNSTNITVPIEPVELIVFTDSDDESTTYLDFVDLLIPQNLEPVVAVIQVGLNNYIRVNERGSVAGAMASQG